MEVEHLGVCGLMEWRHLGGPYRAIDEDEWDRFLAGKYHMPLLLRQCTLLIRMRNLEAYMKEKNGHWDNDGKWFHLYDPEGWTA